MTVLASMGAVGVLAAVFASVQLPEVMQKLYIGSMVLAMGILVFITRKHPLRFSWPRILLLGAVAPFNKGMSGGGHGPLVVSGQIPAGQDSRNSIASPLIAEG